MIGASFAAEWAAASEQPRAEMIEARRRIAARLGISPDMAKSRAARFRKASQGNAMSKPEPAPGHAVSRPEDGRRAVPRAGPVGVPRTRDRKGSRPGAAVQAVPCHTIPENAGTVTGCRYILADPLRYCDLRIPAEHKAAALKSQYCAEHAALCVNDAPSRKR